MTTPVEQQLREYFTAVDRLRDKGAEPIALRLADDDRSDSPSARAELMLSPDTQERANRGGLWIVVAAAVVGLLAGLLVADFNSDDTPAPADVPTPDVPSSDTASGEVTDLGFPGATVEPGRYSTSLLGVPVEFVLDGGWTLAAGSRNRVYLHNVADASDANEARWVMLTRVGGWMTAEQAVDPDYRYTGSIDPGDIDGWIEDNDVIVANRREIEVDDRPTTAVDVQVEPDAASAPLNRVPIDGQLFYNVTCTAETTPCIWSSSIPGATDAIGAGDRPDPLMHTGRVRRMWLIEVGGFEPLLIEAIVPEGDEAWLDEFENTTIATLELGDDAPPAE